ncbi:MAG: DUF2167 domain-containing protein [Flavobacteriales bacterium]|nr:DUF2167 domain-containing protein [Flavobacteriales bacterium]
MNLLPAAIATAFAMTLGLPASSQDSTATDTVAFDAQALMDSIGRSYVDSVERSFNWQRGTVPLGNGVATLNIPEGFKFLDEEQTRRVLVDLWGNPSANGCLGMIFPESDGVLMDGGYAFVVQYDEIGYVKDDDADDIDYDDLLKNMQEEEVEENKQRVEQGFEPAYTLGWASPPFYDKENKVLHWAKEIKFGDDAESNTLNYNVRVLGRKGVLVLNAVAGMAELELVKKHVPDMLNVVKFNDGYRYDQFDSNVDEVAAWTIGGLVAGKVLAKAGILALLLKNIKLVILAIGAGGAAIWRFISGRKKQDGGDLPAPPPQA